MREPSREPPYREPDTRGNLQICKAPASFSTASRAGEGHAFSAPAEPPVVIPISGICFGAPIQAQLLASGLLDPVEAYIAAQGRAVQIAFDNSNSFVRSEPMTAASFAHLGFTPKRIDEFSVTAARL